MSIWRRARRLREQAERGVADAKQAQAEAEQRRDMVREDIVPQVDAVVASLHVHRVTSHVEPMVARALSATRLRTAPR